MKVKEKKNVVTNKITQWIMWHYSYYFNLYLLSDTGCPN